MTRKKDEEATTHKSPDSTLSTPYFIKSQACYSRQK